MYIFIKQSKDGSKWRSGSLSDEAVLRTSFVPHQSKKKRSPSASFNYSFVFKRWDQAVQFRRRESGPEVRRGRVQRSWRQLRGQRERELLGRQHLRATVAEGQTQIGAPRRAAARCLLGGQEPPETNGFHQRAAARTREGVPLQKVPFAHRALADRACAQAERGAGQDLVPESARQVETGQSRQRQQQVRGTVAEPQDCGSHPGACQPLRNKKSAPTAGAEPTLEPSRTTAENCPLFSALGTCLIRSLKKKNQAKAGKSRNVTAFFKQVQ